MNDIIIYLSYSYADLHNIVIPWLIENMNKRYDYFMPNKQFRFYNEDDAIVFKLKFGGILDDADFYRYRY